MSALEDTANVMLPSTVPENNIFSDPSSLFFFGNSSGDQHLNFSFDFSGSEVDAMSYFFNTDPVLISFYIPVFLLSVTANSLVIIVVIKYHYMRNVTNLFLVNLSVADLFVTLLCMPVQVGKAVTLIWYYGEIMCKTVHYMQGVAVAASVFTITAMSVDRYLAITQSIRIPKLPNRKWALLVIALLWLIALAIFAPMLWIANIDRVLINMNTTVIDEVKIEFCIEDWSATTLSRSLFGVFSFVLVYSVPGFIMVLAYSLMGQRLCSVRPPFDHVEGSASTQQGVRLVRERKRVAWILLLLAVLFAVCWLPYNSMQLLIDTECIAQDSVSWLLPYALLLGHANSAINPIVYCFMTKNFRRSVKKLLCRSAEDLSARQHQRCKIRWAARAATTSSGYDSYHSPHRKCYLQMHSMKRNGGTQLTVSGARACRVQGHTPGHITCNAPSACRAHQHQMHTARHSDSHSRHSDSHSRHSDSHSRHSDRNNFDSFYHRSANHDSYHSEHLHCDLRHSDSRHSDFYRHSEPEYI